MLKLEPILDVDEFGMLPYTTDIDRFLNIKVSIQTIERLKGAEEFWTTDVDSQQTSGFCPAKHQDCDFEAFLSLLDVQHTVVKMKAPQTGETVCLTTPEKLNSYFRSVFAHRELFR